MSQSMQKETMNVLFFGLEMLASELAKIQRDVEEKESLTEEDFDSDLLSQRLGSAVEMLNNFIAAYKNYQRAVEEEA